MTFGQTTEGNPVVNSHQLLNAKNKKHNSWQALLLHVLVWAQSNNISQRHPKSLGVTRLTYAHLIVNQGQAFSALPLWQNTMARRTIAVFQYCNSREPARLLGDSNVCSATAIRVANDCGFVSTKYVEDVAIKFNIFLQLTYASFQTRAYWLRIGTVDFFLQ